MIQSGDKSHIQWSDGNWVFLDIGFSNSARSCGLILGDTAPQCVQFNDAKKKILERVRDSISTLNLVIEAPLSVCFDSKGNPKGRRIEKSENKNRYWYIGPGCTVMVAAMYLIREIYQVGPKVSVRLFEGFISYKDSSRSSNHKTDVCLLREVVWDPIRFSDSIYSADQLKTEETDSLCSAFCVAGFDCGIPVVIKRDVPAATI
ncbi:MAG TPA: hypothetical protein VK129_07955 [Terriglobales bacterium]|nr:hypothetical protein [Terriglobales bacterium]